MAVALGAGIAGWATASLSPETAFVAGDLLPRLGGHKTLLDAGKRPRYANLKDMEKVSSKVFKNLQN